MSGAPSGPGTPPPGYIDAGPGRYFFIPPPGETRFVANQVILYIDSSVPLERLQRIAAQAGLTIVGSQEIGLIGQTTYQFEITSGGTVTDKVQQLRAFQEIAGATPLYALYRRQKLVMPEVPESLFVEGVKALVRVDETWVPAHGAGALYIRPVLFSADTSIRHRLYARGGGSHLGGPPPRGIRYCRVDRGIVMTFSKSTRSSARLHRTPTSA